MLRQGLFDLDADLLAELHPRLIKRINPIKRAEHGGLVLV